MKRLGRLVTHPATWGVAMIAALVLVLPALHRLDRSRPLPVLASVPPFALVDQDGRPFNLSRLRGHPTVVDFIFTSCPGICPKLTATVEGLQRETRGEPLKFLSISVDPEHDTPPVLTAYGARFHRDPDRWDFVTGDAAVIRRTVVDGFKVELAQSSGASDNPDGIIHDGHLVLVDGEARIRGYYQSDSAGLTRLVRDARRLAKSAGPTS